MRLTSDFWVSALVKQVFNAGGFAAVSRRGAHEAGTVFVVVRDRMGNVAFYGPAAQASYDDRKPVERQFALLDKGDEEAVSTRLLREERFDPDFWLVEIELRDVADAENYLTIAAD